MGYGFAVNKSGSAIKVTNSPTDGTQIGKIYPREVCLMNDGEQPYYIKFRNSSGNIQDGNMSHDPNWPNVVPLSEVPYGRNGSSYVFKMRRTMNVYKVDGSYWGKVAAGMLIETDEVSCGDTHKDWMVVNYVLSTKGYWVKVDGAGYDHGFVDTGFGSASMYDSWAIQGSL